tara:strand:+ start:61 stop:579 length:519 start_codon:yes stop_codon:yes gene_type:complete
MQNLLKNLDKEIIPISFILILALSRLIPHPPNFTPVIAVAIMSSYFFRNIYLSFATMLISMLIADFFIGFYAHMFFVYASLLLVTFIFFNTKWKINFKNLFIFAFIGSLIFFIISNFGVWIVSSIYEKSFDGLVQCYFLAIPFFKNTFFSTLIFSYSAFLAHKYIKNEHIDY